jgi:hypothetical protein
VEELLIAGAHGGAGTSTLAALVGASWDLGSINALDDGRAQLLASGRPLVVTCRNTAVATRAATLAVTALGDRGQPVSALVVVSDGGPESRDATARLAMLQDRVGGVVRMPFVAGLRLVDDPITVRLPVRARAALAAIRDLAASQPVR